MTKEELIAFRESYGYIQQAMAGHIGVGVSAYRNWEQGITPIPPMIENYLKLLQEHRLGDPQRPRGTMRLFSVEHNNPFGNWLDVAQLAYEGKNRDAFHAAQDPIFARWPGSRQFECGADTFIVQRF